MFFLPIISSIIISIVLLSNLSSFKVNNYNPYKFDNEQVQFTYKQEIILVNAINDFILYQKKFPLNINELIDYGYLSKSFISSSNTVSIDSVSFSLVDNYKIQISHIIKNPNIRNKYINFYLRNTSSNLSNQVFSSYQPDLDNHPELVYHNYHINQSSLDVLQYLTSTTNTNSTKLITCKDILDFNNTHSITSISGKYRSDLGFDIYCDMDTDGGGWTLVLSNLKDFDGVLQEGLSFSAFTNNNTPYYNQPVNNDITKFETLFPLNLWNYFIAKDVITKNNYDYYPDDLPTPYSGEIHYIWKPFSTSSNIKEFFGEIENFNSEDNYTIKLKHVSGEKPGLFLYHNNQPLSTFDVDNDNYQYSCSLLYGKNPFWFDDCVDGSLFGSSNLSKGAHWTGSDTYDGEPSGTGIGSGWIFIR